MDNDKPKQKQTSTQQTLERRNRLTPRRRQLILEFKHIHRGSPLYGLGPPGKEAWKTALCYYMGSRGQSIRLDDIEDWVAKNKWILDDAQPQPILVQLISAATSSTISNADLPPLQKPLKRCASKRIRDNLNKDANLPAGGNAGSSKKKKTLPKL